MAEMAIDPIYPKPNLSKCLQKAAVDPYLLRNADITRPNQAWSIDITYIPMKHGFLYLTAIIDWHSRCNVGWKLDDTLDTRACIEACKNGSSATSFRTGVHFNRNIQVSLFYFLFYCSRRDSRRSF